MLKHNNKYYKLILFCIFVRIKLFNMKTLTRDKLEYLLKNIDWQRIELDEWDYDVVGNLVGSYNNEAYTIDNDKISIEISLSITKEEYCKQVDVALKDVWIDETLYKLEDEEQIKLITNEIIKNLDY